MKQLFSTISRQPDRDAIVCTMGGGVNALSVVRSLGRIGVSVHVIAPDIKSNFAAQSRYCISATMLASMSPGGFYDTVHAVAQCCKKKPILYVDNDNMLKQMLAGTGLDRDVLFTSFPEHAMKLLDKKYQVAVAVEAGLVVPKSWFPGNWDEIAAIKSPTKKHLIAKKRFPIDEGRKAFKVLSAPNGESLQEKLREYQLKPEELFVQEYVEGNDDEVYFALCYNPIHSEQLAIVTGRKLVQSGRGDGGVMALGEAVPNQKVHNLTSSFIQDLNYKGYLGIEFKYCRQRKEYFFIEVNVRPERINALARVANIDLDVISYLDTCGYPDTHKFINTLPRPGVWIDGGKVFETLRRRREWNSFVYSLKALVRKKEWAVFAFDDLRPYWYSLKP